MVNRLSASDASFYRLENTTTPMYAQSLYILRKPRNGLTYEKLLETVEQRLPQIPRYRQKIREVTMNLASPVWVDDHEFDITYHVRHLAVPSPGSDRQLHELVARLGQQPLDRSRPLWAMYLIEGLADNRIALYLKSHLTLVNGMAAPALGHVLVDRTQRPPPFDEDIWVPRHEPGSVELVLGAVGDWVASPRAQLRAVGSTVGSPLGWASRRAFDAARTITRGAAPRSPLNTQVSQNRLFTVAQGELADYRTVRARYDCAINDVVLAVITGAMRNWLMSRGEPVPSTRTVRALAPLSVYPDHELDSAGQPIGAVTPFLVDLPVGEPNPVVRLSQIAYATESHPTSTGLVDARTILTVAGFAPPTLHAMGVRVATAFAGFTGRVFNLLITNAPGAQRQLYVCGAKLLESYSVPPLLPNKALTIGVTSYNGKLYFGVNADRKAMSDVGMVSALLDEALAELLEAAK